MRAAEAVEAALRSAGGAHTIANHDVLTMMPPAFRKVYRDGYFEMVARAPRVLGWLYDATDKPFHKDRLRRSIERAGAAKLLKMIREFDPDVAICTHFLPSALLDRERRKGRCRARIITVVTDFEVHGMWLTVPSDHYFVATDEAQAHLRALGIQPSEISESGIPTHPVFAERKEKLAMRAASMAGVRTFRRSWFQRAASARATRGAWWSPSLKEKFPRRSLPYAERARR